MITLTVLSTNCKAAITWATISTFAGSTTSLLLAETLLLSAVVYSIAK